jgi:pentatricopeptide repeat protein
VDIKIKYLKYCVEQNKTQHISELVKLAPNLSTLQAEYHELLFQVTQQDKPKQTILDLFDGAVQGKLRIAGTLGAHLISVFGRTGDVDRILQVVSLFQQYDSSPKNIYITAVSELSKLKKFQEAENLFKTVKQNDVELKNSAIKMYSEWGRMDKAESVLQDVKEPTLITWNILFNGYMDNNQMEDAERVYDMIKPMNKTIHTWNSIIKMYCVLKQMDKAQDIVKEMENSGERADQITQTILFSGHIENNMLDQAQRIYNRFSHLDTTRFCSLAIKMFSKMGNLEQAEVMAARKPEVSLALVEGYMEHERFNDAYNLIQKLENAENKRSVYFWGTKLKLLSKTNQMVELEQSYMDLKNYVTLNAVILSIVLNAYVENQMFEQAEKFYQSLDKSQITVKVVTIIIKMYCKQHNMEQVEKEIERMKQDGKRPTQVTQIVVLQGYIDNNQFDNARSYMKQMNASIEVWNAQFQIACKENKLESLTELLQLMIKSGTKPDSVTYALMLNAYTSKDQYVHAQRVYDMVVQSNIKQSIELQNSVVRMYCKMNKMEQATDKLEEIKRTRKVDIIVHLNVLNGYIDNNMLSYADNMYKEVCAVFPIVSIEMYGTFIKLFAKKKDMNTALEIAEEMRTKNMLSLVAYHQLLKGFIDNNMFNKAIDLYDSMIEHDEYTFTILLNGVQDKKHLLQVYDRLEKSKINKTQYLYASLIKQCYTVNKIDTALMYLNQLEKINIPIETFTLLISHAHAISFIQDCITQWQDTDIDITQKCMLIMCYGMVSEFDKALALFDPESMDERMWLSILFSCYRKGYGQVAVSLLRQMQGKMQPKYRHYAYTILSCCYDSETGPETAYSIYQDAINQGYTNKYVHGAMIDAYSRGGMLDQAEALIRKISIQDKTYWMTLFGGCKKFHDLERIKRLEKELPHLFDDIAFLLVAQSTAAVTGSSQVERYREMISTKELKKRPGMSIGILKTGEVVRLMVDDETVKPQAQKLLVQYFKLFKKKYNYANYTTERTNSFLFHSERLVIATLLLEPGEHKIIITNTLKICEDCHFFLQYISKEIKRQLIVSDTGIVHKFTNGVCSCNN